MGSGQRINGRNEADTSRTYKTRDIVKTRLSVEIKVLRDLMKMMNFGFKASREMDQPNPTFAKIPILDTRRFKQWKFMIQQYLHNEHYALWEVIEFGDSYQAPPEESGTGSASETFAKKKGRTVAITTEDMQKRRNDVKARTNLLLALPDEHQLRFSKFWKKTSKKITIQGTDVVGFDKSKVECFSFHKMGHFTRECKEPSSQDRSIRESYKQGSKEEEPAPKDSMAIDEIRWDWRYMANEEENHALVANDEALIEFALMAKSSSSSENKVKARLVEFKTQEVKFCEKIRGREFDVESKNNKIKYLMNELEKVKKEKEGLLEFADDTITDYSRPSPSIESNTSDLQNSNSFVSEHGESSKSIMSKPMIKFVKAGDSPKIIKTNKVETARKPPVRYAEMYRNTSKSLNVRGYCDSGCSRQMTDNISYLSEYEPYDGGYVSFGQGGGKITGKGIIKTGKLEFENVYFVKDLKYNLFSVSQICDNKNSVLFTDSECIVLGKDFKLKDDTNVLLMTPRQHNMYSIDLNNIVPHKNLTCLVAKTSADESMLWHRRLGHLNFKTMNNLVRHSLVKGLPSKCFENDHTCVACLKGKQHKASCKTKLVNSMSNPLHTLHMDLFGPTSVSSLNHKWYCLVVTDDFSRFTWTLFLRTKDETSGILMNFIIEIENLKDLKVKIIRCDNGGEFKNKEMNEFCTRKGIKREFSNARSPQQNRVAERRNRTLIEAVRKMLADAKLPVTFWAEAVNTACYVQNRVSFGCYVMILNTLDHLGKFNTKGDEGTKDAASQGVKKDVSFLRYIALPNWFHEAHMESSNNDAQDTCNADAPKSSGIFNPTATSKSPPAEQMEKLTVESAIPTVSSPVLTACLDNSPETSSPSRLISKEVISQEETPSLDNILTLSNRFEDILGDTTNTDDTNRVEANLSNMESIIPASHTPTFRIHKDHPKSQIISPVDTSVQTRHKSKEMEEHSFIATIHQKTTPDLLQFCLFSCFLSQEEPKKIFDALKDPRLRPIGTKWVLKNKKDKRGIVIRNKARLVAEGHTQEEGIDNEEVFAPVARIKSIRLFLAYASFMGFTVYQMDVKSAFLYGTIDEEVYVMQPLGFQDLEFPNRVYKVEKAMYGLHQAPRALYGTLSKYLLANGFQKGTIDQTLFIRKHRGDFLLVQVYGISQNNINDKGYWDSGCSRQMTGNISSLFEYEPYDGGYVSFGQGGGKITGKASADESMLWHRRLGHLNFKTMNKLVRHSLVKGLPSKCFENNHTCVACLKGKQHKASCKTKLVNSVSNPLHTLHMDLFGPTSVSSLNHKWYCLVVTDDFSRFTWTFFLRTKDETSGILMNFIIKIENLKDLKVKIIRCDNGGEFINKEMNEFCTRKGIKREFSNARSPQQNGVAERRNRTLIEAARKMLADAKLPVTFWAEAVNTACTKDAASQGVKKNVSSLRYIALPNWFHEAHMESSNNDAQDACNVDAPKSSGISNPTTTSKSPPAEQMEKLIVESAIPTVSSPVLTACLDNSLETSSPSRLISKEVISQEKTPSLDNILTLSNRFEDILGDTTNTVDTNGVEANLSNMESIIPASHTPTFRIHKDHPKSQIISHVDTSVQTRHKSKEMEEHKPKKIFDALKDPSWVEAIQEKLLQFKIQNVWILVDCPKGLRPIGTKWVLKNKKDERGIVIKNKARLVAEGHTQEEGIDYEEVFAPVARIESIRLFLAYALFMGFTVYQMDVKSVFLYVTIDEEVYAPRALYGTLSKYLLANGFQKGTIDQTLFIIKHRGDFLLVQVPDIMFALYACARHQVTPKECHLHVVKRIFRYLKGHPKLGLWYPKESLFDLVAYSDSDYGGATQDKKSTTGGCQFLGRRLISWQCKKQTNVATSITEAEYVAAASGCGQVL
nr:hypothetical protein [Tanacetum cinerariifolium]